MKFRIFHKPVTDSTNTDARTGTHGDVFTADLQTAGRGRLDHKWLSPPGANLMMSVVLDVTGIPAECVATLPLVVGLAVRSAAARLLPTQRAKSLSLKWPNDVLAGSRKLSGILCERHGDLVIAGIGLNVKQTVFAPEIASRATSLALEECDADPATVRDVLLEELGRIYDTWCTGGFPALHPQYAAADFLKGRTIAVRQTDDDSAPVAGLCAGVQPDGSLLVGNTPVFAGEAHVLVNWLIG